MATLLIRNVSVLVTMDSKRREIPDGALLAKDGFIEQIGPTDQLPDSADEVLDLSGHLVLLVWSIPTIISIKRSHVLCLPHRIPISSNG